MKSDSLFELHTEKKPAGDQPRAIDAVCSGLEKNARDQVLMGVTGSGKTFTMANIIKKMSRPSIITAPNKILAAQLYAEMKDLFPNNAVEYFVSYYDYYRPESYSAKTDTFLEKDAQINEDLNIFRQSATYSLMERRDAIIVASVSSIYGLGSPESIIKMKLSYKLGENRSLEFVCRDLAQIQYERNDFSFERGSFSQRGDTLYVFPPYIKDHCIRMGFFGSTIDEISIAHPITLKKIRGMDFVSFYPNGHYVAPKDEIEDALESIESELKDRLKIFEKESKFVEKQRLEQRTKYDLEIIRQTGTCKGIENYSRHFDKRSTGSPPSTLFSYLPKDAIYFVDESHVSVPQVRGMFAGDRSRKQSLVDHGFRLPSALDNRPLTFEEWDERRPQTVFVSATPSDFELNLTSGNVVSQIIRPTGLLDPICKIMPATNQVDDVVKRCKDAQKNRSGVIVITLTKKMSEDLNEFLLDHGIGCRYMHSDTDTLERIQIIKSLREGEITAIIGVNLLREGIDIPECSFVAIMDADKEGFLRSSQSLIQIIGRAARNSMGTVILYADNITKSIKNAMEETERRRKIQHEFNQKNNITPETVKSEIKKSFDNVLVSRKKKSKKITKDEIKKEFDIDNSSNIVELEIKMFEYANALEFEKASVIRDKIELLRKKSESEKKKVLDGKTSKP